MDLCHNKLYFLCKIILIFIVYSYFSLQMERTQGEERPFLCEDEDFALNRSDEDIKDKTHPIVVEKETKNNQLYKIQRILTLMDKNMTLVMFFFSSHMIYYLFP